MLQCGCCLNNAPTKRMRGDYVAVCVYQFPLSYLTRTSMTCPTKRTTALTTVSISSSRHTINFNGAFERLASLLPVRG